MTSKSYFDLNGKVVLITGGAGLLAKEYAIALATYGGKIYLADIDYDKLMVASSSLAEKQIDVNILRLDVSNEDEWETAVGQILDREGSLDILINNAGYTNHTVEENYSKSAECFPLSTWNEIIKVNLTGSFLGCKVAGSRMLKVKNGTIINIASLYGIVSPHHPLYEDCSISQPVAYSVSKSGVISLTKYLGSLWAKSGVRVNCLTPGGVFNDHEEPFLSRFSKLNPIGRMLDKSELHGAIVFLASDASSHIVGHNLIVDGGWTTW
jgi:NAD(P)-dependent dehydrogenase (short-subunit alcohol dehydrogenase family)